MAEQQDLQLKHLERIEDLLAQSIAIQLYQNGCTMAEIGKHLHIAKAAVVKMLKGVKQKGNGKE